MENAFSWEVCADCGRHGHFVELSTGERLYVELFCQNWAIEMIEGVYIDGDITKWELEEHREKIQKSPLPMEAPIWMLELLEMDDSLETTLDRKPLPELAPGRTPVGYTSREDLVADIHGFLTLFPVAQPTIQ